MHTRNFSRTFLLTMILSALACTGVPVYGELEELIVTARKTPEKLQETPVTVQALGELSLQEQRIESFEDYVKYLPSVTFGGSGPGQNEFYIRGAAVDAINLSVAEAQGAAPNVALYLDEQPVTAGGRNLDVYIADIQRIEVLAGPQGTLFGSSSQAGTVRIITNKPQLDVLESRLEASSSFTANGNPSGAVRGVINIPITQGRFALRAVVFSDTRGGYIDNVESTLWPNPDINPRLPAIEGIEYVPEGGDPTSHQFADGTYALPGRTYPVRYTGVQNTELVEDDYNRAAYQGFRIGGKYVLPNEWDLTVVHHQQTIEAEGVFDYDPEYGDLKVARYSDDWLNDTFGQTSWTVEGRLGKLEAIYTGAYLGRDVEHHLDYSEYIQIGGYIPGYICEYNAPGYHGGGGVGYTFDPTLSGDPGVIECARGDSIEISTNTDARWTHEFRLSGALNERFSVTGGVYFQDRLLEHVGDFHYRGTTGWPQMNVSSIAVGKANNRETRGAAVQFTNDITRTEEEIAFFGELTTSFTDQLSAIVGFRQYFLDVGFEGFSAFRYGSRPVPNLAGRPGVNPNPMGVGGRDYATNLGSFQPLEVDDLITKFGVSYQAKPNLLIYGTISDGYRPPGVNRAAAAGQATAEGVAARGNDGPGGFPDYFIPVVFLSDSTKNYELGWKGTFNNNLLRLNGSVYFIDWTDIQVSHFDSQNISIFTLIDNGGDAEIVGFEMNAEWLATQNMSVYGGLTYNSTELVRVNPTFDFVVADPGSELPLTPKLRLAGRVRYEWSKFDGTMYWQLGGSMATESFNSLVDIPVTDPRQKQDPYQILDATLGFVSPAGWQAEAYINNLTDERAQWHINRQDFRERITTNRPRTMGFRFTYDFE